MKIDKLFEHLLNEVSQDYSQLTAEEIYDKGLKDPNFDFKKGLDSLITKDKTGEWVYRSGRDWKTFDYNKGLNDLLEKDKEGYYIFRAGKDWKTFDYNKGLDDLIEKDETGRYICFAGREWSNFDFKKGMEVLEKIGGEYLKQAKETWPKSYPEKLKDVKDKYDENHIPGKRKKLKR